jgi:hypothetical protein
MRPKRISRDVIFIYLPALDHLSFYYSLLSSNCTPFKILRNFRRLLLLSLIIGKRTHKSMSLKATITTSELTSLTQFKADSVKLDTIVASAIPDRSLACNSRVSAQEGAYPPSRLRAFALATIN